MDIDVDIDNDIAVDIDVDMPQIQALEACRMCPLLSTCLTMPTPQCLWEQS